jgi:nickel/cobalt transporter (NicO) family protein
MAGILAAFLYGVFHTLAVGHGKTVVVGYFLGNRARPIHGVAMASWIAVSHVVAAIVVALATHWILERSLMSPVEQNHWIRMTSFGAIALIGAWMLVSAWRATGGHHHHHHDHDHHHHGGGTGHRRLLAVAAGFVPCSGAILILTFAIANGILLSGLAMVLAIAVGMALTLAGLGLASMLLHHQVMVRFAGGGRARRWLGLLGPLLILIIGGLLFLAELSIIVIAPTA